MYLYLIIGIFPRKFQHRLANDLLINTDLINRPVIYKNNYCCTFKTKLRSFQIKLNFRAIVLNAQLFGFGLIKNDLRVFCERSTETVLHLFCA